MQLEISGIAKIEKAKVELRGITVIAGENNTGKSTVGKILFAMNEFMNGFDQYIEEDIKRAIGKELNFLRDILDILCKEHYNQNKQFRRKTSKIAELQEEFINKIYSMFTNHSGEQLEEILRQYAKRHMKLYQVSYEANKNEVDIRLYEIVPKLKEIFLLDENELGVGSVTYSFGSVFNGQINSLNPQYETGEVVLTDHYNKKTTVRFQKDECYYVDCNSAVNGQPIFIENPHALDSFSRPIRFYHKKGLFETRSALEFRRESLRRILRPNGGFFLRGRYRKSNDTTSDINITIAQKKLKIVKELLARAVSGEYKSENGELLYLENGMIKPSKIENLSTGLKAMILLEQVISLGLLQDGSTLILDEPEINLHPEWQLLYAEIIVLIQEIYNLNIVLTTHSPYFLKAVEMYVRRERRQEICKYYAAENIEGKAVITDMTDSINTLFRMLAEPLRSLKLMENEMEKNR